MHVQVVLFDGFDLLDAIAPYEVFCAARLYAGDALSVELVAAEGARPVPSGMNGPSIPASGGIDPGRPGIILVPGASGAVSGEAPDAVPAILRMASETRLIPIVEQALADPAMTVATVCGGSLLLAMGGLLEGRHAVTNRMGMEVLGATGAIPVEARVVDEGNLITGGGVTSGLDVALYLVERELGPRIANAVEKLFEYERRGTVWQARGLAPIPDESSAAAVAAPNVPGEREAGAAGIADESGFAGSWRTVIATPIGKLAVQLNIAVRDGRISGNAVQGGETAEFVEPRIEGSRLTWSQRVTKPMRLNLKFDVAVNGDRMTGTAKAGMLPASKVEGERISGA